VPGRDSRSCWRRAGKYVLLWRAQSVTARLVDMARPAGAPRPWPNTAPGGRILTLTLKGACKRQSPSSSAFRSGASSGWLGAMMVWLEQPGPSRGVPLGVRQPAPAAAPAAEAAQVRPHRCGLRWSAQQMSVYGCIADQLSGGFVPVSRFDLQYYIAFVTP